MSLDTKKAPSTEVNEASPNLPLSANCNDPKTNCDYSRPADNFRAARLFLSAIPGMNREELHNALQPLSIEHMAPGPQQAVFTAARGVQHRFPVRGNRIEALTLIQSRLIRDGSNTPEVSELIVDIATAPNTGIPVEHLAHAVQMEHLARECWQAVEELLNPEPEQVAA